MTTKKKKATVTILYAGDGKGKSVSHTNISETIQNAPCVQDAAAGIESIILARVEFGRILSQIYMRGNSAHKVCAVG